MSLTPVITLNSSKLFKITAKGSPIQCFIFNESGFLTDWVSPCQPKSFFDFQNTKKELVDKPPYIYLKKLESREDHDKFELFLNIQDLLWQQSQSSLLVFALAGSSDAKAIDKFRFSYEFGCFSGFGSEFKILHSAANVEASNSFVFGTIKRFEDVWEFNSNVFFKFSGQYLSDYLPQLIRELSKRSLLPEQQSLIPGKSLDQLLYKDFRFRNGQEIPLVSYTNIVLTFDTCPVAESFDVDLSVLLFNANGIFLDYLLAEKDQFQTLTITRSLDGLSSSCSIRDISRLSPVLTSYSTKTSNNKEFEIKYIVFLLTCYEHQKYSFLWSSGTKLTLSTSSTLPICQAHFDNCVATPSLVACVLYRSEEDHLLQQQEISNFYVESNRKEKWVLRFLGIPFEAKNFVDAIDMLYETQIVEKHLVEENLDWMNKGVGIYEKDLLNLRVRHLSYKSEELDRLWLFCYGGDGYLLKLIDNIFFPPNEFECFDKSIRYTITDLPVNVELVILALTCRFKDENSLGDLVLDIVNRENGRIVSLPLLNQFPKNESHKAFVTYFPIKMYREKGVWRVFGFQYATTESTLLGWYKLINEKKRNGEITISRPEIPTILRLYQHLVSNNENITISSDVSTLAITFEATNKISCKAIFFDGSGFLEMNDPKYIRKFIVDDVAWYNKKTSSNLKETEEDWSSAVILGEGDQCQLIVQVKTFDFSANGTLYFAVHYFGDDAERATTEPPTFKVYDVTEDKRKLMFILKLENIIESDYIKEKAKLEDELDSEVKAQEIAMLELKHEICEYFRMSSKESPFIALSLTRSIDEDKQQHLKLNICMKPQKILKKSLMLSTNK